MIHVYTTQSVDPENIDQFIKLNPKVPFVVEVSENGLPERSLHRRNFLSARYLQSIKRFSWWNHGKNYSVQVPFGEMEPTIAFVNTKEFIFPQKVHGMSHCKFQVFLKWR